MLTGKGVTAWQHALADLAPAAPSPGPLPASNPLPGGLAAELVNALAALALTGT